VTNYNAQDLLFVPLGGAGEIGMNLNLYGHKGKWLMVDCGMTFADAALPGIDLVLPNPSFVEQHSQNIVALVLTHAHEDHIGAIPYLWPRLKCPIYATPFTAALLRRKLVDAGLAEQVSVKSVDTAGGLTLGPFHVRYVGMTHSIPEANALAIETSAGLIFHTGDWKLDDNPMVGLPTDVCTISNLGDNGVLAMVCDSTNVFRSGESGSELTVRETLLDIIKKKNQRVVITSFASNVARVETAANIAIQSKRHLVPVGRSMWRTIEIARETGYLVDFPDVIRESDARDLKRSEVLYLCTGCQGEPRAAMMRIATGSHPHLELDEEDTVIFSSRIIPGNERAIGILQNLLVRGGIEVITERDNLVHVSGHPARDDLRRMYEWVRPRICIPVHGEARHIWEHARYASSLGVPTSIAVSNGDVVRVAPDPACIIDKVSVGRLVVDGSAIVDVDHESLRHRRKLTQSGLVIVSIVVGRSRQLAARPKVTLIGIADLDDTITKGCVEVLSSHFDGPETKKITCDEAIEEECRRALRGYLKTITGKRPRLEIHVCRVVNSKKLGVGEQEVVQS